MELTWYGRTCVRLKGRDAVVVADAYQAVVGPTGRGITADIEPICLPSTEKVKPVLLQSIRYRWAVPISRAGSGIVCSPLFGAAYRVP